MRPRRLEVEGFTAFRTNTVVDFEGADLFAFVGPTGSGKSSLVDALLFALYGVVPRYGNKSLVEPVISLGKNEARVRFDFSVGDGDYTAVRVVRRTKSGATTAEARLESGAEPIMGADEVTEAVEELLGLGFDHFIKCVVLPQGQFAAFLHDSAAKRQELLRQLLDLGRYRHIRDLAVERQRTADNRVEVLTAQIEGFSFATNEAQNAADTRRDRMAELLDEIDARQPELEQLRLAVQSHHDDRARATRHLETVRSIKIPSVLAGLAELADKASSGLEAAEAKLQQAVELRQRLDKESAALPDATTVAQTADLYENLAKELAGGEEISVGLVAAEKAVEETKLLAAEADTNLQEAARRVEEVGVQHAAHALARRLEVGKPCPVCRRDVDSLPADETPEELNLAEQKLDQKRKAVLSAASAASRAGEDLAAARSRLAEQQKRVVPLREQLSGRPDAKEIGRLRDERSELDLRLREGLNAEKELRRSAELAAQHNREVAGRLDDVRRTFDAARDSVAALSPPVPERMRVDDDWKALSRWAQAKVGVLAAEIEDRKQSADSIVKRISEVEEGLAEQLVLLDIVVGDRRIRDACVEALAEAKQQAERISDARIKAATLTEERNGHRESALVAKTLARHLAVNGFEGWVMAEALEFLVEGANERLDDLTSGAFSLELNDRDFRVIDHRNADERRSVKTLSGGETFLVSLALALALAEQLASMSVHGVARLESMFLDEGFGTLDAETLDVVAAVIHELGSDGRTIGLITHVQNLAEQVPVRFEVRKGPGGATVERVDA